MLKGDWGSGHRDYYRGIYGNGDYINIGTIMRIRSPNSPLSTSRFRVFCSLHYNPGLTCVDKWLCAFFLFLDGTVVGICLGLGGLQGCQCRSLVRFFISSLLEDAGFRPVV